MNIRAVLVAAFVAATLVGCGGGRAASRSTAGSVFSQTDVRYGPTTSRTKVLPPGEVGALLSSDRAVRAAYARTMTGLLDVASAQPAIHVGVFGTVVSRSGLGLVIEVRPATLSTLGDVIAQRPAVSSAGQVDVSVTSQTDLHLLPQGLAFLGQGASVFVGGQRKAGAIVAEMLADPTRMFTRTPQSTPPSTAHASGTIGGGSGGAIGQARLLSATSGENADTVELSGKEGWPGIDEKFSIGIGSDSGTGCYVGASVEFILALGSEYHWSFQFQPAEGDGFTVDSHDRSSVLPINAGPIQLKGESDPSANSIYVGMGLAFGANFTANCHVQLGPFGGSIGFEIDSPSVSFAFQNQTTKHVPLDGEADLEVEPSECPSLGTSIGPVTVALATCDWLSYHGGLFRATLTGQGGHPQGIAMGYGSVDHIQHATAPSGGPVAVDQFNYAAQATTRMVAGVSFTLDLGKTKGIVQHNRHPFAHAYTSHQRKDNQRGPTTPDGSWKDNHGVWRDQDNNTRSAPPTDAEIQQGYANWIHPQQKKGKGTLADGRWQHENGKWHDPHPDPAHRFTGDHVVDTPSPADLATANKATAGGDEESLDLAPPIASDLQGWNLDTTTRTVAPADASPSSLELDYPVAAAPPLPTALIVSTTGQVGTLQIGHSTEADIRAAVGAPAATARGSFSVPQTPDYQALGYNCNRTKTAYWPSLNTQTGTPPYCQTVYYLNTATGTLQGFWTASPTYQTAAGTTAGMSARDAQQKEARSVTVGCNDGITLGDQSATAAVLISINPTSPNNTVAYIAADSKTNSVGVLFC